MQRFGDAKELVHLFQGEALCFGHEKVDKDAHEEAEAAKQKVHAVAGAAHGALHGEDGAGGDEVEEPLGGGGEGDVEGAQAGRGNLADEDPAGRAPAKLERRGPEVDAGNGDVAKGRDGLALGRGLDAAVDGNEEEHDALRGGGGEEAASATERIGHEEQEDGAADDFDDAVDSGGEQGRVRGIHAEVGE